MKKEVVELQHLVRQLVSILISLTMDTVKTFQTQKSASLMVEIVA